MLSGLMRFFPLPFRRLAEEEARKRAEEEARRAQEEEERARADRVSP